MPDAPDQITPRLDPTTDLAGLFDLDGNVAWVPGGAGGLGQAIAWGLAGAGAAVAVSGRNGDRLDTLVRAMTEAGHRAVAVPLDVEQVPEIETAAAQVAATLGGLDILVNCVGIQREEPLLEVTEAAFDEVYRVNMKAAMFLAQAAARCQAEAGGGRQVHLLSVRSKLGLRDRGYSAYAGTKGALVMLVRQHAVELARHGITVNGVAPTFVYTEMIRHVMENDAFRRQLLERIPLGRIADPRDVVGPVLFFAAPAAGFVTGQVLYVDGGITACQ